MDAGLKSAMDAAPAFEWPSGKVSKAGSIAALAGHLGLTRSAICQWDKIPAERVVRVETVTGVPRSQLRPDLYEPAAEAAVAGGAG